MRASTARQVLRALSVFFILLSVSGCTLGNVTAQQEKADGLWDELIGGKVYGQSFVCTGNNLYRIDLGTATYARINSAPVTLHLRLDPQASADITSVTLPGSEIQNDRPTSFTFSPLPDSQGRTLYFFIESPGATSGNAITVYANSSDQYLDGTAYQDGHAMTGDLAFTAYSQETFTFTQILRDFLSGVKQDLPFFIFFALLLLLVSTSLIISLVRRAPAPPLSRSR